MSDETKPLELRDLIDAVRGGEGAAPKADWTGWDARLEQWVEAYPAFGAGRMLRAKTSRETRSLSAAQCLAQAAVFSSEPGRLFDLLFRAGIESEIASFARAVEALEPKVEDALKWRWHPEGREEEAPTGEAPEEATEAAAEETPSEEAESEAPPVKVEVPEKGTLAREVVLGAIERSIEKELEEVRSRDAESPGTGEAVSEDALSVGREEGVQDHVDLSALSPLARWAYQRSHQTGFAEAAESRLPSAVLKRSAEQIEEVMGGADGAPAESGEGGLEQQAALIDLFIRNEPTIGPIRPEAEHASVKELAKESLVEDASLITETMARIYAQQGQIGRARRAYKLLALKYPEKSVYFAAQSKKLGRKEADD